MGVYEELLGDARCGSILHLAVFLGPWRPCCVHPSPGGQALRSAVGISCLRAGLLEELYVVVVALLGSLDLPRAGQRLVPVLRRTRGRRCLYRQDLCCSQLLEFSSFSFAVRC